MVGGRPLRVLAYVRVSTTEQGDRGTSLETQREEIERFYAESGARFFGGSTRATTDLRALAASLRRIETRHEP